MNGYHECRFWYCHIQMTKIKDFFLGGGGGRGKGVYYQIEVSFIEVPALSTPGPSLIFTLTPPK